MKKRFLWLVAGMATLALAAMIVVVASFVHSLGRIFRRGLIDLGSVCQLLLLVFIGVGLAALIARAGRAAHRL